jgi:hypothetical protein
MYNILKNYKNIILTDKIDIKKPYKISYDKIESHSIKINFDIESKYNIEYLKIYLITSNDIYPLDSNINFKKDEILSDKYKPENKIVYQFLIPRNIGKNFNYNVELPKNNYKFIYKIEYPFITDLIFSIYKPDMIINKKTSFIEEIIIN